MVSFEYGNARLRAMKARLFSEQQLAELMAAGSVAAFLNALTKTAYRPVVEAALLHHQELAALHQAMRRDLIATAAKIHTFFSERERELVALVLRRYDVQNVKTTLRGLARHLPSEEILNATLPLGDLLSPELMALAGSEDVRAAVDLLATWLFPAASIVRQNLASSAAMEVALERWYVQMVLDAPVAKGTILPEAIKLEADVMNILTALRLADVATKQPGEMDPLLAQLFGTADLTAQFVGPGQIPLPLLVETADSPHSPMPWQPSQRGWWQRPLAVCCKRRWRPTRPRNGRASLSTQWSA
jgi:vacuolar-type H+-ATPase subunit C/Vma6